MVLLEGSVRMLARRLMNRKCISVACRYATNESLNAARALNKPLKEADPELFDIIEGEKVRLRDCLNLIASENMTSRSVYDALGSVMNNKYSEGMANNHAPLTVSTLIAMPYVICITSAIT